MEYTISQFVCPVCGGIMPLPRRSKKPRENGHIKDLYCPWCKEVRKFMEYKSGQPIRNMDGEKIG